MKIGPISITLAADWATMRKWWSVQISAGAGVLSALGSATAATGAVVPWFGVLPRWEVTALASVVFWAIFLSRIIKQKEKANGPSA